MAATASSKSKRREKSRSGRNGDGTSRRLKPSVGPIDYEQRRQHIKLAYTKSIRESEAQEARLRAAERRREELAEAGNVPPVVHATKASSQQHVDVSTPSDEPEITKPPPIEDSSSAADSNPRAVPGQLEAENEEKKQGQRERTIPTLDESLISTGNDGVEDTMDSPTLGLPGSFPDYALPLSSTQPPMSTVSATSETTEFDGETQTCPPVPAQPSFNTLKSADTTSSPQKARSVHQRAEYKSPFEEHDASSPSSTADDRIIPTPQEQSPLDARASYLSAEEAQHFLDAQSSPGEDPDTQNYPTSSPDPQPLSSQSGALPLRQHNTQYGVEKQANAEPVSAAHGGTFGEGTAVPNAFAEAANDDGGYISLPGYYPLTPDGLQSYRASTCASSEAEPFDDRGPSHYEGMHRPDTGPNRLAAPALAHHSYNAHRQSAWTDFSVDSTDISEHQISPAAASFQDSRSVNRPETAHAGVDHENTSTYESESVHQLPEVDMGEGFTVPYLAPAPASRPAYVPSPDHEPPPIPVSAQTSALNSRTSSAYYEQDQYDSALLSSERESDEYMSHVETAHSVDSTSLATTDQYASTQTPADSDTKSLTPGGEELSDKERHRLMQRRNVIKELVDTEAVFVRDMNIVEEIYKGTAEACPGLDDKTIKLIFRNSDQIIAFHTAFLAELKEAVADVYTIKSSRSIPRDDSSVSTPSFTTSGEPSDARDRTTTLGPVFKDNMEQMKVVHEGFLRASDPSAKRLIQIQQDPAVQVWLNECNEVAKDLTAAWDLDSLLIKPMQRITKYPNLIITLLQHTPHDHPDRVALTEAKETLETAIVEINKTKKNFELVGQIVGRKRKESDVKAGFARAFGKRVDKLQASANRPAEDADYAKLNEKFGDDYLRLQVVLRDVEFYTRQVSAYVQEFLRYMSSIELVMRLQPGSYPELESKWVQFNISVRDLEKVALEDHLAQVRKHVIEPFEHVIKAYGNPSLAMKKREKRRLDFERSEQLRRSGKGPDPKLKELVEQYDALNDTLKKELPKLSALTERVGNICLGNFVSIQAKWYAIWMDKMKTVFGDSRDPPDIQEIVSTFQQDFPYAQEQLATIGILNPSTWGRTSLTASMSTDDASLKPRSRPSDVETRGRGHTVNGDLAPTLPTPDFVRRRSGSFAMSPSSSSTGGGGGGGGGSGTSIGNGGAPSPHQYYYRDYYAGISSHLADSASNKSPETAGDNLRRSVGPGASAGAASTRPSTSRSYESGALPRQSTDSSGQYKRDSNAAYGQEPNRYSNMFHSALPLSDGPDESYKHTSRSSSRERSTHASDGYNVLWLAASLFEFNISTTKHEAGYPYLTYQAGEVGFDAIQSRDVFGRHANGDCRRFLTS